jgi:hypothetical protein
MVKFFRSQWQDAIPLIAFIILSSRSEGIWQYFVAGFLAVYWSAVILFRYWWKDYV